MTKGDSPSDKANFDPLRLLEDEPVSSHAVDELTLLPFAKAIAGTAMGTKGPFTIGMFADWGQGKTSVLRQAKSLIESKNEPHIVTVWFNAWQFENEAHPMIPLIATIAAEVEKKTKTTAGGMWKDFRAALGGLAYGFSVPGFSGKNALDKESELLKKQEQRLKEQSLYYQSFDMLADFTRNSSEEANPAKIIVFIDDLDRCLPPNALKLLESIKLVLAQQGFIFVLAVDRKVLESFLSKRYRDDFGIEDYEDGVSYLDKIVQLPMALPTHKSRFDTYICGLLERDVFQSESNKDVKAALLGIKGLLATGANHNPRSLVRIINNLIIDQYLMRELGINADKNTMSLCAISRFLQQHLGLRLYHMLAASQPLCDGLVAHLKNRKEDSFIGLPKSATKASSGSNTSILDALTLKIESIPALKALFGTEAAKNWLENETGREQVNDFLSTQREDAADTPADQKTIVDDAIRKVLDKKSNAEITEDDRQKVAKLNFVLSDITDAGLASLAKLANLKNLWLSHTQITDAGLASLAKLANLQNLGLIHTQITDAGQASLAH
ncbi:MAG: P-loop NTPase fold protein, partial [Mariprofundaceae bacterium]